MSVTSRTITTLTTATTTSNNNKSKNKETNFYPNNPTNTPLVKPTMLLIATERDDDPDNDSDDNINDCRAGNKVYVTGKELFSFSFQKKITSGIELIYLRFYLVWVGVKQIRVCHEACSKCTMKN